MSIGNVDHSNVLHAINSELRAKDSVILLEGKLIREEFLIVFDRHFNDSEILSRIKILDLRLSYTYPHWNLELFIVIFNDRVIPNI